MPDQAQRLREIVEARRTAEVVALPGTRRCRTMAVTSGKGGVGKTNLVTNLAVALARRGKKVMIVDADLSLANIHVLLGLQPRFNLSHVIWGEKRIGEVILEGPRGIRIIPASSGVQELAMLREAELEGLTEQFSTLDPDLDLVLIDTAAGLSDSVLCFVHAADEVLLVTTPEPTAYMDGYQTLKTTLKQNPSKQVHLVVNMAASEKEARETVEFLQQMADRFLGFKFASTGWVLRDPDVPLAIRSQRAFLEDSPHGVASRCIQSLATRFLNAGNRENSHQPPSILWQRIFSFLRKEGKPGQ